MDHGHHHHGHHHHHGAHGNAAEVNKPYWDEQASKYDARHEKLQKRLAEELLARLDFVGVDWADEEDDDDDDEGDKTYKKEKRQVRLLDYACGTGAVSKALAPHLTHCVGIDISKGMVDYYNSQAANQGLLESREMYAVVGDLALASDSNPAALDSPEFRDFDLAAVGGGFHHFGDPELAAKRLVERLRPGKGVLFIWDFLEHERHDAKGHDAYDTIMHHGFSEARVRKMFEDAGAGKDFGLQTLGEGVSMALSGGGHGHGHGHEGKEIRRSIFVARGTRA